MSNEILSPSAENAVQQMEIQAINFAYRFVNDSRVRMRYMEKTKAMSKEIRLAYKAGKVNASQAAEMANKMRNEIMEFARSRSSDLGRAKAKVLKAKGLNIAKLTDKYANRFYKKPFSKLTKTQQSKIYLEIVDSAGRANPKVNLKARRLGAAGRALWVITACIALYNISTSENKLDAAGRETAGIGGGVGGGAAGGAVAGIWFGPVGIIIGTIIGGILGSIAADQVYVEVSGPDHKFAKKFLPRFTTVVSVDEEGIANALIKECSINMDRVFIIMKELVTKYSTDADDVAYLYVKKVKQKGGAIKEALKMHIGLRNILISSLDDGWTTNAERECMTFLKSM